MDGPDAPEVMAAQALRLERAEHDPAVLQDDRVQGHAEVQVADALDVAAVVVHDEELQGQGVRRIAGVGALKALRSLTKTILPPGTGSRAEVVDAPGRQRRLRPVGRAGVRREGLLGQLDDLARRTWTL